MAKNICCFKSLIVLVGITLALAQGKPESSTQDDQIHFPPTKKQNINFIFVNGALTPVYEDGTPVVRPTSNESNSSGEVISYSPINQRDGKLHPYNEYHSINN